MRHPIPRICGFCLVLAAPLLLTGCGLISGLINTALGLAMPAAQAKALYRCVPESAEIDTPGGPRRIESLRVGDSVIGYSGAPVRVLQKHEYLEADGAARFMRVTFANGSEVRVCDMHRIGGERAMDLRPGSAVDGHVVVESERYGGVAVSYDLLTEDAGYRIQGIPVNSMIEEMSASMRVRAAGGGDWKGRQR